MKQEVKENKEVSIIDKIKEQLIVIEKKTGVNGIFVIVCLILSITCVYLNIFDNLITNLVGTVYPAFWTMKSIETRGDDDKQWLTYWVVFASFTIVDMFSGFIVKFVPFYFVFKIIFLIWLFMPNSQGAYYVYHLMVVKVFKSFENDIDNATNKLKGYTSDLVSNGSNVETFTTIKEGIKAIAKMKNMKFPNVNQIGDSKPANVAEDNGGGDNNNNNATKLDDDDEDQKEKKDNDSIIQCDSEQEVDNEEGDNGDDADGEVKGKANLNKSLLSIDIPKRKHNKDKTKEENKAKLNRTKIEKTTIAAKEQTRNQKMKLEKKQTYAQANSKLDTTEPESKLNTSYVSPKKKNIKDK